MSNGSFNIIDHDAGTIEKIEIAGGTSEGLKYLLDENDLATLGDEAAFLEKEILPGSVSPWQSGSGPVINFATPVEILLSETATFFPLVLGAGVDFVIPKDGFYQVTVNPDIAISVTLMLLRNVGSSTVFRGAVPDSATTLGSWEYYEEDDVLRLIVDDSVTWGVATGVCYLPAKPFVKADGSIVGGAANIKYTSKTEAENFIANPHLMEDDALYVSPNLGVYIKTNELLTMGPPDTDHAITVTPTVVGNVGTWENDIGLGYILAGTNVTGASQGFTIAKNGIKLGTYYLPSGGSDGELRTIRQIELHDIITITTPGPKLFWFVPPRLNPPVYLESFPLLDYSTVEQETGRKWIDGKMIYQKTCVDCFTGAIGTAEGAIGTVAALIPGATKLMDYIFPSSDGWVRHYVSARINGSNVVVQSVATTGSTTWSPTFWYTK